MFKEKYTRDMEDVRPTIEALNKTKEKMYNAESKKPSLFGKKQIVALAACFCLIVGSFTAILLTSSPFDANSKYSDQENPYVVTPDNIIVAGNAMKLNAGASYEDIFSKLEGIAKNNYFYYYGAVSLKNEAVVDEAELAKVTDSTAATSGSANYSDTNNQVAGVQEADIVKTDGKYIYACGKTNQYYGYYSYYNNGSQDKNVDNTGRVYILSADNGNIELISTVKIRADEENEHSVLTEILLYGDTLVLIKSGYHYEEKVADVSSEEYKYYGGNYKVYDYETSVEIYDITDRTNPVFQNELYQSGMYNSSRMIGSDLYIITTHYVSNPDEGKPETYIPYCSSYTADYLVPADSIYVAENVNNAVYTVITGMDVTKPDNHISDAAVLGFTGTVYSSGNNIYIAAYRANDIYNYGTTTIGDTIAIPETVTSGTVKPEISTATGEAEEPSVSTDSNSGVTGATSGPYIPGKTVVSGGSTEPTPPDQGVTSAANSSVVTSSASVNSTGNSENLPETKISGTTDLYRFAISDGVVTYSASGSVAGSLLNQFSMDEYNGAFRLATTVNEYRLVTYTDTYNSQPYSYYNQTSYYNNLYILDEALNVTGSIAKIASNEKIYSVRFDGEIGYMVTFRQTDPLFAIDLSDTTSPKILSALKIPGFSSYMQSYGDGLLFGFGKAADVNTGGTQGLKLSMFDVSDKADVTEQSVLNLGSEYYNSPALNNHKAILVDAEKNLIGFPVDFANQNSNSKTGYVFYTYENEKFIKAGSISVPANYYNYAGMRGLYIGDYVYLFSENAFIKSYDISTFTQVDSVEFS